MLYRKPLYLLLSALVFGSVKAVNASNNEYITGLYYSEWTYHQGKLPIDIPLTHITHIYYAFMKVDLFEVTWDEESIATEQIIPLSSQILEESSKNAEHLELLNVQVFSQELVNRCNDLTNSNVYSVGLVGQLSQMKSLKNGLRILMSIGGADSERVFNKITKSKKSMTRFADSAVSKMYFYGFDGIDIDWEYPESKHKVTDLVKIMDKKLKNLEKLTGLPKNSFLLTMAIPLDISTLRYYDLKELGKYIPMFNVMAYDMAGTWSESSNYGSNLYANNEGSSIDLTIMYLLKYLTPSQIVLGMPNYGRSFNTYKIGGKFTKCGDVIGVDQDSDECIIGYSELPPNGFTEVYNQTVGSSYAYNEELNSLIVYDTPEAVREKARYVRNFGLKGGMWWDSSGDPYFSNKSRSLLLNFVDELGGVEVLENNDHMVNNNLFYGELMNQTVTQSETGQLSSDSAQRNTSFNFELETLFLACIWLVFYF